MQVLQLPSRAAARNVSKSRRGSAGVTQNCVETLEPRRFLTVVVPGATVATLGTTAAARPELAGVVIRDALIPFTITSSGGAVLFKGTLQDRVVRENVSGTLDFYEAIRTTGPGSTIAKLDSIIRENFAGFATDVDYRTDGLGAPAIHPLKVTRSPTPGASLDFQFGGVVVGSNQDSRFFFIKTNATSYTVNGITAIEMSGGVTAPLSGAVRLVVAEPIQPVPPRGTITGTVYNDSNADGKHEFTEPGLSGWTVYIDTNHNGKLDPGEKATTTNLFGRYSLVNLAPGTYEVREVAPVGWHETQPTTGFYTITVTGGGILSGFDFGNTRAGKLGGLVTLINAAGAPPQPVAGETVYLDLTGSGAYAAGDPTTKTDSAGHYSFNDLPLGGYLIGLLLPAVQQVVTPGTGNYQVDLLSGEVIDNLNFVLQSKG